MSERNRNRTLIMPVVGGSVSYRGSLLSAVDVLNLLKGRIFWVKTGGYLRQFKMSRNGITAEVDDPHATYCMALTYDPDSWSETMKPTVTFTKEKYKWNNIANAD